MTLDAELDARLAAGQERWRARRAARDALRAELRARRRAGLDRRHYARLVERERDHPRARTDASAAASRVTPSASADGGARA
ncbi:hypothetical protein [Catenuloplanes atrovinosus]|uniref:Uncharacterized protein n=1 Tax=Catenuloplanes atrovinosus TaxID=137266 RepID=A0AAE4CDZ3_9ACTN|nr:hypothetical protein [Catenuloplanes atrovinosus]MDR7279554.1 hypothetical protein [Catenuloplanes atrovinosus]